MWVHSDSVTLAYFDSGISSFNNRNFILQICIFLLSCSRIIDILKIWNITRQLRLHPSLIVFVSIKRSIQVLSRVTQCWFTFDGHILSLRPCEISWFHSENEFPGISELASVIGICINPWPHLLCLCGTTLRFHSFALQFYFDVVALLVEFKRLCLGTGILHFLLLFDLLEYVVVERHIFLFLVFRLLDLLCRQGQVPWFLFDVL